MLGPWLSVWGLVADMAGVAIITWDVWPEYRLYRLQEDAAWKHRAVLANTPEQRPNSDVRAVVDDMLGVMALSDLNRVRRKLGLPSVSQGRDLPTREQIAGSMTEAEGAIAAQRTKVANRSRPPIGLGFLLVLAGFGLQLAGAWPR